MSDSSRAIRLAGLLACALACSLALGACSGDDSAADTPRAEQTQALWNPCDGLPVRDVSNAVGTRMTVETGKPNDPLCRFTPATDGGPVITSSYQLFSAGLDAAWKTMGDFDGASVTEPTVGQADAARLVVRVTDQQLYVTGFVQDDDLIQVVDLVDPAPFTRPTVVAGVTSMLAMLSKHALTSGR